MSKNPNDAPLHAASPPIAQRFFVEGHVQGVFFREWTVGKAREMGLSGWVRNLQNGHVEVYAIGELVLLERFAEQLRKGSPASRVANVRSEAAEVNKVQGFTRRQTA